ncbi:hypothetical protein [Sphingomonas sp. VNH70]|uniref:hypothetical protein n=1 Tax=Sphingomonas silueang TaxID=3156617 RepID=UPI0032B55615
MRALPPLSVAAACALALAIAAWATPLGTVPASGLWWLAGRFGAGDAFAHLLPVLAAGAGAAALTRPLAPGRRARPWAAGIAAAMLSVALLLPVPLPVLAACLPFAVLAGAGRWVGLALAAAVVAPLVAPVAMGVAAWLLTCALSLPGAANDNQPVPVAMR